ncbi:MAG: hypothetical protein RLZ53_1094, partial [Actinomycetota bacterium]
MLVTYGLTGKLEPSARRMPPTTEMPAKSTERIGIMNGDELTRTAAAAGVTSRLSTSSAPT